LPVPDEIQNLEDLEPEELALGELLSRRRPAPAAGFRGALARRLAERDPGWGPRPPRLRLLVCAYGGGGLLLIAIGAVVGLGAF
jgi:hypothetical protein